MVADGGYGACSAWLPTIVVEIGVVWHIDLIDDLIGTRVIPNLIRSCKGVPASACLRLSQSLMASLVYVYSAGA